jgi:hypothetical protein
METTEKLHQKAFSYLIGAMVGVTFIVALIAIIFAVVSTVNSIYDLIIR